MRPMTRRTFGAAALPVLGAAFSCSFGDDEDEDDKKPNAKKAERDGQGAREAAQPAARRAGSPAAPFRGGRRSSA
jgi:predicted outer membrane protein